MTARSRSSLRVAVLGLVLLGLGACRNDNDGMFSALAALGTDNNPPTIAGTPRRIAKPGQSYLFQPTASDPDGNTLRFTVRNKPKWASFDQATGRLSGRPSSSDAGVAAGVVISVSDGLAGSSVGPFDIRVDPDNVVPTTPTPVSESGDQLLHLLEATAEGTWLKVNRNRFQDVWTLHEQRAEVNGTPVGDPHKIISAWGSMAWDCNRAELIIWGGGHADYAGNDVYRFHARTLRWARASLPSRVIGPLYDNEYFAADGAMNAPTSAHTYDNQEFLPLLDRFITFGGANYNSGRAFVLDDGVTKTGPYLWDPSRGNADMVGGTTGSQVDPVKFTGVTGARMWQNRDSVARNGTGSSRPDSFVNGTSAYGREDGQDVVYVSESPASGGDLFRYRVGTLEHPSLDSWDLVGVGNRSYSGQGAGALDPRRGLYLRTARFGGTYGVVMWDTNAPGPANTPVLLTPRDPLSAFVLSELHGMDYDPKRDVFAFWDGGPDIWYLKPPALGSPLETARWSVERAPVDAREGPDARGTTGVLGKWKYVADYDVMIGLGDSTEGAVWVYKPVDWQPTR